MTLQILIDDDHDLVRRGIRGLLQSYPGWNICAEAMTGREAVAKVEELKRYRSYSEYRMFIII
jgi:two-component system, NarL family, response regulator NreC